MSAGANFQTNRDIPEELLLGFLCFQHLDSGIQIAKTDLEQLFANEGLGDFVSELDIKPHDAFRRATGTLQNFRVTKDNQETVKLLLREIDSNNDEIKRVLIRETVVKGKNPEYKPIGAFHLYRDQSSYAVQVFDQNDCHEKELEAIRDIHSTFLNFCEYHTKETVSNLTNRILKSLNPIPILPNGRAKFTHKSGAEVLHNLQRVIAQLGGESVLEIVPFIDTEEQRDTVFKEANAFAGSMLDSLIYEVSQYLSGKEEMTARKLQSFGKRVKEVEELVSYYDGILNRKSLLHQGIQQLKEKLLVVTV